MADSNYTGEEYPAEAHEAEVDDEDDADCHPPPVVDNADELDSPDLSRAEPPTGGSAPVAAGGVMAPPLKIFIPLPEAPAMLSPNEEAAARAAMGDPLLLPAAAPSVSGVDSRLANMAWTFDLETREMSGDCIGVQRIYAKMLQSKTWW
jgi:hypothetical protein